MTQDRLEYLIKSAEVRNDESRRKTMDKIRVISILRNKEAADELASVKSAGDVRAFLEKHGLDITPEEFVSVLKLVQDEAYEEEGELPDSELEKAAGGRYVLFLKELAEMIGSLFD